MSNVIIVTGAGGLNEAIVAGGQGLNGPYFPIKYFLLAYDPALDPTIHGEGVTSATPFSATATFGDTSLIQNGGHYIFKKTDYVLSSEQFLILSGAETQVNLTTIGNSDKAHATTITLSGGKPLLNVISGTSPTDLYTTTPGQWHCSNPLSSQIAAVTASYATLLANTSNYFSVDSYTPISSNAGSPSNSVRGLFKCRVGSQYGNFKFNKIGLYIDTGSTPVLFSEAMLSSPITKTKEGANITNIEFDIEVQFYTDGALSDVVYMTQDYWTKVPTISGYALTFDGDIAIGSSGIGWYPKAKLDISSNNNGRPILCLNNRYSKNYMFFDIPNWADNTTLSGTSTLRFFTTSKTYDSGISKYVTELNRYYDTENSVVTDGIGSSIDIFKYGVYSNSSVAGVSLNGAGLAKISRVYGIASNLSVTYVPYAIGLYSYVTHNINTPTDKTFGTFSEANGGSTGSGSIKYGVYGRASRYGQTLYGVYGEAISGVTDSYGVYGLSIPNQQSTYNAYGVYGSVIGASGNAYGVVGDTQATLGTQNCYGVKGSGFINSVAISAVAAYGGYFTADCNAYHSIYDIDEITLLYREGVDVYAVYAKAGSLNTSSYSKKIFGIYSEVAFSVTSQPTSGAYAGYFKAPTTITRSYAISADGRTFLNGILNVSGATTLANNLTINGFTSLGGAGHIGLKCKLLTDTTSVGTSASITINHGLTMSQIVSFNAFVDTGTVYVLPNDFQINGDGANLYTVQAEATYFKVINGPDASFILGKPITIIVWYKQ